MSTRAASVSPALHALLEHVVDYAGLFPPAALPMSDAAAEYAAQRTTSSAWMLGRFVVPVARLDELVAARRSLATAGQGSWPLSVLASADSAGDAEVLAAFSATHRELFVIASVELRAATAEAIGRALASLDPALERYVEIRLDADPRPLLDAIARHAGRAKARTGGVTPDAFPSAADLARFIAACAELELPFKATAGLHHPLRGEQRLTYESDAPAATMFGFLGVFVAAALARSGADEATLVRALEERDAGAFTFSDGTLRWRDRTLDVAQVAAARRDLAISFGSCSFREPVKDLERLGIL
jgi:hypothetical protein